MKVFVTGVNGYIGAVLGPYLMERGLTVRGLDTGYYRDGWLFSDNTHMRVQPFTINKDLRDISAEDIEGCEGIAHLAELSNDPLGQNNPQVTHQINHKGSVALAEAARRAGIPRFVYTSSCSVYGAGTGDFLDETAAPNPQTAYAECKALVERDVGKMAGRDFCPVFLRNATAYGPSPRMRFDIVLNDLSAMAHTTKRIAMVSDGSPWRPVVHIEDICEAIYRSLIAPADAVRGKIFNVGANSENYRVRELAEIVASEFPGCEVSVGAKSGDTAAIASTSTASTASCPASSAAIPRAMVPGSCTSCSSASRCRRTTYAFRAFTRLKQLKYLQATQQIDADFRWR